MQISRKEICKMISEEHPEFDEKFLLEVDKFIFDTLKQKVNNPTNLIYDLSPLGRWTFRKKITKDKLQDQGVVGNEITPKLQSILSFYETYTQDKLEKKYEIFGKESHEAYLLAKEQKKLQKRKEVKPKKHFQLPWS